MTLFEIMNSCGVKYDLQLHGQIFLVTNEKEDLTFTFTCISVAHEGTGTSLYFLPVNNLSVVTWNPDPPILERFDLFPHKKGKWTIFKRGNICKCGCHSHEVTVEVTLLEEWLRDKERS